jgi:hypothetical protein
VQFQKEKLKTRSESRCCRGIIIRFEIYIFLMAIDALMMVFYIFMMVIGAFMMEFYIFMMVIGAFMMEF